MEECTVEEGQGYSLTNLIYSSFSGTPPSFFRDSENGCVKPTFTVRQTGGISVLMNRVNEESKNIIKRYRRKGRRREKFLKGMMGLDSYLHLYIYY